MKRDFSTVLRALGRDVMGQNNDPMTLAEASISALMADYGDEKGISGEVKFKRYQLAARVQPGGLVDVSAEEVATLKQLIGKAFTPVVVGPAYEALELDPTQDAGPG